LLDDLFRLSINLQLKNAANDPIVIDLDNIIMVETQ
jgi:hypothetical protein